MEKVIHFGSMLSKLVTEPLLPEIGPYLMEPIQNKIGHVTTSTGNQCAIFRTAILIKIVHVTTTT